MYHCTHFFTYSTIYHHMVLNTFVFIIKIKNKLQKDKGWDLGLLKAIIVSLNNNMFTFEALLCASYIVTMFYLTAIALLQTSYHFSI